MQQLVDLNGDTTNFDLTFTATCPDGSEFKALVVNQTTLDNNPNLEYKIVEKGTISGNIIADKNVYQNYFLCLKSEKPCTVNVNIVKKEIEGISQTTQPVAHPVAHQVPPTPPIKPAGTNWKIIIIVLAVIFVGGIFYMYTKKNKETDDVDPGTPPNIPPNTASKYGGPRTANRSLMERLNNLSMKT